MPSTVSLSRDELIELTRKGLEETMNCAVVKVESFQYSKRQSSTIVGLNVHFADGSCKRVWAKSLHPGGENNIKEKRTIRDFDLHRFLRGKLGAEGAFRVAHALYHSVEHRLIVTEHVPGTTLHRRIKSHGRVWHLGKSSASLAQDCCRVGAWLKAFQTATLGYFPGMDYGQPAPMIKNVASVVELAQSRLSELEADTGHCFSRSLLRTIREYLEQQASSRLFSEGAHCCIHGDFFADNIFLQQDVVTGLDFTSATWGLPEIDPCYFAYQIETLPNNPSFSRGFVFALRDAFLEGYLGKRGPIDFWKLDPTTHLLFVTLSLSRMLALAKLGRSGVFDRFVARRQSLELQTRLMAHLEHGANFPREA